MRLRFRTSSLTTPSDAGKLLRRPPRILITGPPGSGRTTLSRLIAQRFGLVNVSVFELLQSEIARKTAVGREVKELIDEGKLISDSTVTELVKKRLNETDCKVNGWTLEGYPKTEAQVTMLRTMRQIPSLIVLLELDDDVIYERHEYKKVDPSTGEVFNLKDPNVSSNKELLKKLVAKESDRHNIVKKRLQVWKDFAQTLPDFLKERKVLTLAADKSIADLVDAISETIESIGKDTL
eukprot:TRINITY_DN9521_c0_g1_i12.p1 TRINITY_DN9521_c0_g1~~TRINITY_DN9521_c0_g1_i12.p1  ORF type:complete len:237 (-),score=43.02 TRINITY_DN9521_c0_g1_i12:156-866(-)